MNRMKEPDKHSAWTFAAEIRDRIKTGIYPAGYRLPPIRRLAEDEGVGRGIVETALGRLRAEGLLEARRGSGTFVRAGRILRVSPSRLSAEQWGQGKSIQSHDAPDPPQAVDVRVGDVLPSLDVAYALGVEPGVVVLSRYRRFVKDGRSVQLATSYLPTELTRGTRIEHTDTGPGGTYQRLAEQGWKPTRFTEQIIGRAPTPGEISGVDDLDGLGLRREGAMVFEITRHAFAGDRCVEVTRMVLDAGAYELIYNFSS